MFGVFIMNLLRISIIGLAFCFTGYAMAEESVEQKLAKQNNIEQKSEAKVFGLLDVYKQALEFDSQFKQAEYAYLAQKQDLPIARSEYLPQLSLRAGMHETEQEIFSPTEGVFTTGDDKFDKDSYTARLSQTVFDLNKLFKWREAKSTVRAAAHKRTLAAQELLLRTAEVYFGVLLAQNKLTLAEAESAALEGLKKASEKRKSLGLADDTEQLDAYSRFQLSEANIADAEFRLAEANNALMQLAHMASPVLQAFGDNDLPNIVAEDMTLNDWTKMSQQDNLELQILKSEQQSAKEAWRAAKTNWFPKVEVVASYGRDDSDGSLFGEARDIRTEEVGIMITQEFFTGGRLHHTSRKAKYQFKEKQQKYLAESQNNKEAIRIGLMGVKSGIRRVAALKDSMRAKQAFAEGQKARFRNGLVTNTDVLDAIQSFYQVNNEYASARYEYIMAALKFRMAVGSLSVDDLKLLDDVLEAHAI